MEWAIGVDGGGTHTRAALVDGAGVVRGVRVGGCGNFQRIGTTGLQTLLDELLSPLLALAGVDSASLCLALAGAGRTAEQEEIALMMKRGGWRGRVCVESDARAALEGAHAGGPGLIAIAGTGSIVLGKNNRQELVRAGGWGPLLGDEGSAYYLGLQALQAATRNLDGAGPDTELVGELVADLGLQSWDQLVPEVYGGRINHARIAALGPLVSVVAERGDVVALDIVDRAGAALGVQIAAVADRLGLVDGADLCCMGGVFSAGGLLQPALQRAAAQRMGHLSVRPALLPAMLGAVLLAWGQKGQQLDEDQLFRLRTFQLDDL